ncbi:MAG: AAA family ATPase, partial [Anaerolineales bacterium]
MEIASRPAQSLLAYLAMHPGVAHRREKLAGIFWPEASDRQARSNLRYTLWQVRKAMGGSKADRFIQADKIAVTFLEGSGAWVDAVELGSPEEEAAGSEGLIRSLSLYGGELLPGFYEEWVVLERDRLSGRYDQRMNRLLDRLMEEGRWAAVFEWAERWISHGHGPEPAFRALMRAHAALDDAVGLAAAYSRCRESLRQQVGVDPSPATVRLFQELSSAKPVARETRLPTNEIRTGPPEPLPPEAEVPEFLRAESEVFARRPYAGRETELGRLHAQLDQVVRGSGKVTLVVGEVGKGKTALVEEFARRAEAERPDLLLVSGACDVSTGPGDPYLPFREVLAMLAGDVEPRWAAGSIPREHALRLWRASSITMEALAERAPELISLFLSPNALRVWLERGPRDGRARQSRLEESLGRLERSGVVEPPHRNRIFEAYTDVLTALAEAHPLLVVLDDLHWLDPSSASLLVHLARRLEGKRILIIGTYRPEDISPLPDGTDHPLQAILAELKQIYGDIWMDLDRGGEAITRPLVDALVDLEPNELGAEFRDPLAEVTEGNPLFVLELLQHLQEKGDLVRNAAGQWVIARAIDWQVMPVRVEGVIEERMAHLDRELREALVIASVQGDVFIAEAIARVQGVDERALVRRMTRELQDQHRLVSELGVERIGDRRLTQFRFSHILIQRYLEQRLGQSERSYLHEAIGKALEDLYADHTARAAHRLARHFAEASLAEKAVYYLQQAGEQALK